MIDKSIASSTSCATASTGSTAAPMPRHVCMICHTFAVRRLMQWHRDGVDLDQRMLALSTYLGHTKITDTYWYLSAVPELMVLAGDAFERFVARVGADDA